MVLTTPLLVVSSAPASSLCCFNKESSSWERPEAGRRWSHDLMTCSLGFSQLKSSLCFLPVSIFLRRIRVGLFLLNCYSKMRDGGVTVPLVLQGPSLLVSVAAAGAAVRLQLFCRSMKGVCGTVLTEACAGSSSTEAHGPHPPAANRGCSLCLGCSAGSWSGAVLSCWTSRLVLENRFLCC